MISYKDKVVVITGGGTGIGFAFAKAFGRQGAKIVIAADRHEDRLRAAVASLAEMGVDARWTTCDVTSFDEVEALADYAWTTFGHVDVILNNAGVSLAGSPVINTPMNEVRRILDINLLGVWHGSIIFGRRFISQARPAAIYNVGSENSLFNGVPGGAAYVASKHAVLALTESLREEMPEFIHVSLICPGFVQSELGPEEYMAMGMDTDLFVDIAMKQLCAGEFYVVSHAYNAERIAARIREISRSYQTYAPRYDGDDEFDVRTIMAKHHFIL